MSETVDCLQDAAEIAMRSRGYHGVSFRELADDVGIKSASVHYYRRKRIWPSPSLRDTPKRFLQISIGALGPRRCLDCCERSATPIAVHLSGRSVPVCAVCLELKAGACQSRSLTPSRRFSKPTWCGLAALYRKASRRAVGEFDPLRFWRRSRAA